MCNKSITTCEAFGSLGRHPTFPTMLSIHNIIYHNHGGGCHPPQVGISQLESGTTKFAPQSSGTTESSLFRANNIIFHWKASNLTLIGRVQIIP